MNINNFPMVSVIIPVFNGATYIRSAVQSVLDQTFKDFEILVVDDGSTDGTFMLLEPWIKNRTIRYAHQNNRGAALARNAGLSLAQGTFLKFLDADDFIYPQLLEQQVNHLKDKSRLIISVANYELEFESNNRKTIKLGAYKGSQLARFIQGNIAPIHAMLVSRSLVEEIKGFNPDLACCEDTDLWLKALLCQGVFEIIDYVGCCYRILNKSVSSDPDKMFRAKCKVFENLNQTLLTSLDRMPQDVLQELLVFNTKLTHMCFVNNIDPDSFIPMTMKASRIIYGLKMTGLKKFLSRVMGIKNINLLKYFNAAIKDPNYAKTLINIDWRDEKNHL